MISACVELYSFAPEKISVQSLPSPARIHKNFSYKKTDTEVRIISSKPFREGGEELRLSLAVKNKEVATARYSTPETLEHSRTCKKLVIILPIYNSEHTYPQHALSLRLLFREKEDTNILVIKDAAYPVNSKKLAQAETKEELAREIRLAVSAMHERVITVRRFIDWAETRKEICKDKIGIVGFSIGASFAVNTMSVDNRISSGAFVMGGGELHNIFAFSKENEMSRTREQILARFKWNKEIFAQFIKPLLNEMSPETYAGNINPQKVLYINSLYDDYIPKAGIEQLWEALGRPERIQIPYGHKFSFLSMTPLGLDYTNVAIDSFFEKKL